MKGTRNSVKWLLAVTIAVVTICGSAVCLFAGVRQMRVASDNTNIGTNPYKDMETNPYAAQNPPPDNYGAQPPGDYYAAQQKAPPPEYGGGGQQQYQAAATYDAYGTIPAGGYYYDNSAYGAMAPQGALIPIGTVLQYIPSTAIPIMVGRNRYYYDSNVFFSEVFDGGAIVYQVVPAPVGAVVSVLPLQGCFARTYNGRSVTVCGNNVYMQVAGGYQVMAAQ